MGARDFKLDALFPRKRTKHPMKHQESVLRYEQKIIEAAARIARLGLTAHKKKAQLSHNNFSLSTGEHIDITLIESFEPGAFFYLSIMRRGAKGQKTQVFSHLKKAGKPDFSCLSQCDFALMGDLEAGEIVARRDYDRIGMIKNLAGAYMR